MGRRRGESKTLNNSLEFHFQKAVEIEEDGIYKGKVISIKEGNNDQLELKFSVWDKDDKNIVYAPIRAWINQCYRTTDIAAISFLETYDNPTSEKDLFDKTVTLKIELSEASNGNYYPNIVEYYPDDFDFLDEEDIEEAPEDDVYFDDDFEN